MSISQKYPNAAPEQAFDFANSASIDPSITVTRSSPALYYGKEISKADENGVPYSQDLDNAVWIKQDVTVTPNVAVALDGTTTADLVTESATTAFHKIYNNSASFYVSYSSVYYASFYAKNNGAQWIRMQLYEGGAYSTSTYWANFDILNGVVGLSGLVQGASSVALLETGVIPCGNGWYRCYIKYRTRSGTEYGGGPAQFGVYLLRGVGNVAYSSNNANETYAGDGTSGAYIWGAQSEIRDFIGGYKATTASRFSSSACMLNSAPVNTGRINYDPITGQCLGLLLEYQKTNYLTYSNNLNDASWTKTTLGIFENSAIAPDGTATATYVYSTADTGTQYYSNQFNPNGYGTLSVYAKAGTHSIIRINNVGYIDLSTGVATKVSGDSREAIFAIPVGNGWYRCCAYIYGTYMNMVISGSTGTANWLTGTGFYVWGHQYEFGKSVTSYIATSSSAATRASDSVTLPLNSKLKFNGIAYPSYPSTVVIENSYTYGVTGGELFGFSGNITIDNLPNTGGSPTTWITSSSPGRYSVATGLSTIDSVQGVYGGKVAIVTNPATGYLHAASNGNISQNINTGTLANVSTAFMYLLTDFNVHTVKSVRYYTSQLSDTNIQALTS